MTRGSLLISLPGPLNLLELVLGHRAVEIVFLRIALKAECSGAGFDLGVPELPDVEVLNRIVRVGGILPNRFVCEGKGIDGTDRVRSDGQLLPLLLDENRTDPFVGEEFSKHSYAFRTGKVCQGLESIILFTSELAGLDAILVDIVNDRFSLGLCLVDSVSIVFRMAWNRKEDGFSKGDYFIPFLAVSIFQKS